MLLDPPQVLAQLLSHLPPDSLLVHALVFPLTLQLLVCATHLQQVLKLLVGDGEVVLLVANAALEDEEKHGPVGD